MVVPMRSLSRRRPWQFFLPIPVLVTLLSFFFLVALVRVEATPPSITVIPLAKMDSTWESRDGGLALFPLSSSSSLCCVDCSCLDVFVWGGRSATRGKVLREGYIWSFFRAKRSDLHAWKLQDSWKIASAELDTEDEPSARHKFAFTSNSTHFFMVGGKHTGNWSTRSEVFSYSRDSRRWKRLSFHGDSPGPSSLSSAGAVESGRYGHCAVYIGSSLFTFGGFDGQSWTNSVFRWDLETQQFEALQARNVPPAGREGHACTILSDSKFLVSGGADGQHVFFDAFVFDTESLTWTPVFDRKSSELTKRAFHAVLSVKPNILRLDMISPVVALIGGRTQDGKPFRENIVVELATGFSAHTSLLEFPVLSQAASSCLAEESFCIIYGLQSEKFGNSDYKGPVLIILEGISQSVLHSDKISIESAESRNRVPKSRPVADEFHLLSHQNLRSDMNAMLSKLEDLTRNAQEEYVTLFQKSDSLLLQDQEIMVNSVESVMLRGDDLNISSDFVRYQELLHHLLLLSDLNQKMLQSKKELDQNKERSFHFTSHQEISIGELKRSLNLSKSLIPLVHEHLESYEKSSLRYANLELQLSNSSVRLDEIRQEGLMQKNSVEKLSIQFQKVALLLKKTLEDCENMRNLFEENNATLHARLLAVDSISKNLSENVQLRNIFAHRLNRLSQLLDEREKDIKLLDSLRSKFSSIQTSLTALDEVFLSVPDKKPEEEMTEDTVEDDYSSAEIRSNLRSLIDIENSVIEKTREKTGESSVLTHSLRAATEASIKKLQTRMSLVQENITILDLRITNLSSSRTELEDSLPELKRRNLSLESELFGCDRKIEDLRKESDQYAVSLAKARSSLEETNELNSIISKLLEDLHSNRTSARRSIQDAEDVLQYDLAEMSALVPVLSKHVENLRSSKVHFDQIVQNERSRLQVWETAWTAYAKKKAQVHKLIVNFAEQVSDPKGITDANKKRCDNESP